MSDGLTAEQEARRRYPYSEKYGLTTHWMTDAKRENFVAGAEWATERERARAEAAEARVAELGGLLLMAKDAIEAMAQSGRVRTRNIDNFPASYEISVTSWEAFHDLHWVVCRALAAPTTEAVTE